MRGLINVIIGLVFIVGLSGKLAMRGTESGAAPAAIGVVPLLQGVYRMPRLEVDRRSPERARCAPMSCFRRESLEIDENGY
jgi:hypothetical protein